MFTIRSDHFVHDDHVCNLLLDDLVINSGSKPDVNNVARGPDQACSSVSFWQEVTFRGPGHVHGRITFDRCEFLQIVFKMTILFSDRILLNSAFGSATLSITGLGYRVPFFQKEHVVHGANISSASMEPLGLQRRLFEQPFFRSPPIAHHVVLGDLEVFVPSTHSFPREFSFHRLGARFSPSLLSEQFFPNLHLPCLIYRQCGETPIFTVATTTALSCLLVRIT